MVVWMNCWRLSLDWFESKKLVKATVLGAPHYCGFHLQVLYHIQEKLSIVWQVEGEPFKIQGFILHNRNLLSREKYFPGALYHRGRKATTQLKIPLAFLSHLNRGGRKDKKHL